MRDMLSGSFAAPRWTFWPQDRIRVVNWNIERGLQLEKIIAFLEAQRADILILQEADLYARRTGFRNIAEEIAKRLRMNYAFGYEFEELAQGRPGAGIPRTSHAFILATRKLPGTPFSSTVQLLETKMVLAAHGALPAAP